MHGSAACLTSVSVTLSCQVMARSCVDIIIIMIIIIFFKKMQTFYLQFRTIKHNGKIIKVINIPNSNKYDL